MYPQPLMMVLIAFELPRRDDFFNLPEAKN